MLPSACPCVSSFWLSHNVCIVLILSEYVINRGSAERIKKNVGVQLYLKYFEPDSEKTEHNVPVFLNKLIHKTCFFHDI